MKDSIVCKLCRKLNHRPKKVPVGKAVWVDISCVTVHLSSLKYNGTYVEVKTCMHSLRSSKAYIYMYAAANACVAHHLFKCYGR